MADPRELEKDAVKFAQRAVTCDQNGLVDTAVFYYMEAAQALLAASLAGSQTPGLLDKAHEYTERLEVLKSTGVSNTTAIMKSAVQLELDRAKFLIYQAFEEDENGSKEEAVELYMQTAELCLQIKKQNITAEMKENVLKLTHQAINRAEELKQVSPSTPSKPLLPTSGSTTEYRVPPLGLSLRDDEAGAAASDRQRSLPSRVPPSSGTSGSYTKEELHVLRTTSNINGREYVPFMHVDTKERFAYPIPFSDKHGRLALSPKQEQKLGQWSRPDEFLDSPQMIFAVSSFSIKQTVVSDCSFVASLAISAQYERRFKKKLITSIIYPQNRQGEPQYNPCGKYMVKLNLNGVQRKVVIDDFLPVSRDGQLLCSHSSNKSELWVSLLEKAYLKVMGGYNFPGSNSNIDLHALTGWIPERLLLQPGKSDFNAVKEFDRIMDRYHRGDCLVTLATGEMSEAEADRAGLVPTHAYAMLDIRIVKGVRLLLLKNPWSHLRWKGNYSENDLQHWTPEMKKTLNYDPKSAQNFDNGVFWIDYESAMKFYDVVYMNWSPDLFRHTTCMHHTWTAKEGPRKDFYNIGDNPQYKLEVKGNGPKVVWILMTRHITDKDDFASNKEFITVLVYKTQGKRVFYPYDPPPYMDGVRINSPHYLCKMLDNGPDSGLYTLVVSQYDKSTTIHYTIRAYSNCEFILQKISEPYNSKYERELTGKWSGKTAGGCANYADTYHNNPIYQLKIDNQSAINQVLVELKGPKNYAVGLEAVTVSENVTNTAGAFKKKASGNFRRGFCVLELDNIPGGVYNIRPCTFLQNQEGPFFISVSSSVPISLTHLQ